MFYDWALVAKKGNVMSNANSGINLQNEVKSASKKLKPLLMEYLSNFNKLENLSKALPSEEVDKTNDSLESELMLDQEKLGQKLSEFELKSANDAIKILNVWIQEEINPSNITDQQALILNVHDFLKRSMVPT